jgi:hypothetical protein
MEFDQRLLDPTVPKDSQPQSDQLPAWAGGFDQGSIDPTVKKATQPEQQQEQPPMSWQDAAWQALRNTPKSAVMYGKSLVDPVLHPVDTAKAVGNVAVGAAQSATGSTLGMDDKTAFAQAIGDYYKNRYGGMENIKKTVSEDPVSVAGDIAAVLSLGGGALSKAGKLSDITSAARAGGLMSQAATWIDPMTMAVRPIAATGLPEKLYGAALKPSTTLSPEERAAVISAGMGEKIPVSYGGALKNGDIRRDLAGQLEKALTSANTPMIDPLAAADRMRGTVQDALTSYNPTVNLKKVSDVRDNFLTDPLIPDLLTPKQANEMKQGIYREVESAYGNMRAPFASQAKKDLARGLKEEVNAAVPEVAPINDRLSTLIQLAEQLDPAANRVANRNPIGLTATTAAAAGAPVGRPLSSGALGVLLSSPWWGSRASMLLDNVRNGIVGPNINGYGFDPAVRGLMSGSDVAYDQRQ